MKSTTLRGVLAAKAEARAIAVATRLSDGDERLINLDAPADDALFAAAITAAARDQSAPVEVEGETWFINVFNPPIRLAIVGAVHIAQPLSGMAAALGWQVTIIDPRTAFASEVRFPKVAISHEWPDVGLDLVAPDARTAVVTLTHDPKLDDPALMSALRSKAFFIGSLGSKKTHAARLARLAEAGFDEAAARRIRGPVGLSINARSPAEIAVSILAQIVETLRAGPR